MAVKGKPRKSGRPPAKPVRSTIYDPRPRPKPPLRKMKMAKGR